MATETAEESGACAEAIYPEHLHLRIARKALTLNGETMGISFLDADGRGCCADVFYEPMEEFHKSNGADVVSLLAHVAAHEVGHLLLGTNSHAAVGIMQARWTPAELASSRARMLVFTEREARQMKERLSTGLRARKASSQAVAAQMGQ